MGGASGTNSGRLLQDRANLKRANLKRANLKRANLKRETRRPSAGAPTYSSPCSFLKLSHLRKFKWGSTR